jgi:C4-dicarboxylate-specific signal transduction histidine kinase
MSTQDSNPTDRLVEQTIDKFNAAHLRVAPRVYDPTAAPMLALSYGISAFALVVGETNLLAAGALLSAMLWGFQWRSEKTWRVDEQAEHDRDEQETEQETEQAEHDRDEQETEQETEQAEHDRDEQETEQDSDQGERPEYITETTAGLHCTQCGGFVPEGHRHD